MKRHVAALFLAGLLGGCGAAVPDPFHLRGTPEAQTPISKVPDVVLPPRSAIDVERSIILGSDDQWLGRIVLTTPENVASVGELIRNGMVSRGWRPVAQQSGGEGAFIFMRSARTASISVSAAGMSGARVVILVLPRDGAAAP